MKPLRQSPDFGTLIRDFFSERLLNQQNVSPHTVAAYRDTFRLLFGFLRKQRRRSPDMLALDDIDAPSVLAFLRDLEKGRGNCVRTRNSRLGAIRAFVRYASARDPSTLPLGQRVLAIPQKRFDRPLLGYLTRAEVEAVLNALDRTTWSGRRDHALFMLMYNTGARVSEAIALCRNDAHIGPTAFVHIRGKGRKERSVPLWKPTANVLKQWLLEINEDEQLPLFPNRHGQQLSRSGVEDRLRRAVSSAATSCPTLRTKNVSPHTLRHSTAMHMLQAGVDITLIALWLGHESTETTHQYVEADLEMKRRTLDRIDAPATSKRRRKRTDPLTAFLDGL
jgi:site-specific recombinase XerD